MLLLGDAAFPADSSAVGEGVREPDLGGPEGGGQSARGGAPRGLSSGPGLLSGRRSTGAPLSLLVVAVIL